MPPTLTHTSIQNILIEGLEARLVDKLLTEVDDDAKAGLVRSGKLQDDPTTKKINILIYPGGEEFPDVMDTHFSKDNAYELGGLGSAFWRRRFRVDMQIFFTREAARSDSRQKAHVVLSRAHHAMMTQPLTDFARDSFGERAYAVQVTKAYLAEGGGEGDYNWRGQVWVEYWTEIDFQESLA